jgi:hypothetical protein
VLLTIKVRDASGAERTLATDATLSPIPWDTASGDFRDGVWNITLVGTDGALSNTTSFRVEVRNLQVQAGTDPIPTTTIPAGGSLLLNFNVANPAETVTSVVARVRAGTETDTVTLRDDGTNGDKRARDGVWSATYTPKAKGTHTVDLTISYQGETQPATRLGAATFQAEGLTSVTVFSPLLIAVVVLGVVVLALGGVGIRRWK